MSPRALRTPETCTGVGEAVTVHCLCLCEFRIGFGIKKIGLLFHSLPLILISVRFYRILANDELTRVTVR